MGGREEQEVEGLDTPCTPTALESDEDEGEEEENVEEDKADEAEDLKKKKDQEPRDDEMPIEEGEEENKQTDPVVEVPMNPDEMETLPMEHEMQYDSYWRVENDRQEEGRQKELKEQQMAESEKTKPPEQKEGAPEPKDSKKNKKKTDAEEKPQDEQPVVEDATIPHIEDLISEDEDKGERTGIFQDWERNSMGWNMVIDGSIYISISLKDTFAHRDHPVVCALLVATQFEVKNSVVWFSSFKKYSLHKLW